MLVEKSQNNNYENLQKKLQDINNQEGISGYILRGSKSAAINLKDSEKIIEYAIFSSAVFDISCNMSDTLNVGEVQAIVVESKETKLLSMNIDNHRLSIFMEKSFDHNKLYNDLK